MEHFVLPSGRIFALVAMVVLTACGGTQPSVAPPAAAPAGTSASIASIASIGPEQNVVPRGQWNTQYVPDDHMTYLASAGFANFWISGGTKRLGGGYTLALRTKDFLHFIPRLSHGGTIVPVLGPNHPGSDAPDADYAGPGSVIPFGHDLLMIYHGENHTLGGVHYTNGTYYSSILLARSHDDGLTWKREGAILTGMDPKPSTPKRAANGAGIPSAIVTGGYVYVLYTDWNVQVPDVSYIARAPLASGLKPGSWGKWYRGGFSQPGIGGKSTPVLDRPAPAGKTVWAANDDVSYNSYLKQYLDVFSTAIGVYLATSRDLVHWKDRGVLFPYSDSQNNLRRGQTFYDYPTFLTPGESNDRLTGQTGYLYYAKAPWAIEPHTMYRRAVTFR
jgi:hypothetical protein